MDVYVNYRGTCEEAFLHYERHLGGTITSVVRHSPRPGLEPDLEGKVLHARVEIGSMVLMGADVSRAEPMRSAYLTLSLDGVEEAERIYAALVEGGEVFVPLQETPFARRFAMLRDRFGASWMLLHQPEPT